MVLALYFEDARYALNWAIWGRPHSPQAESCGAGKDRVPESGERHHFVQR
jgi:hypothetical protein